MLKRAEQINGYHELSDENKKIFAEFLLNFYRAWEFPERYIPLAVRKDCDEEAGEYLRVEFDSIWLHVKSPTVWY